MTARNAPLMLIGTAIVGWIGLRALFVLLSVPVGGLPPPLFVVDTGEDNFTILPPMLRTDLDAPMANVPKLDQPLPRRQMAGLPAHMVRSAVPTAARTPTQIQPTLPLIPRNNVVVAAQALLLDRMLGLRPQVGRPIGHGAPALIMSGHAPAFIPARRASADAWSITAGIFVRQGSGRTNFGPGLPLGGSQAWARLGWQPDPAGPQVFARANSAGRMGHSAEIAAGVAMRPIGGVPVQLVAERRQRIGREGRSAFAAYAVAGAGGEYHGWRLDSYGAAGVVGASRQDAFAEGSATVTRTIVRFGAIGVSGGGGAWGAAQPGAQRVDIGPMISARSENIDGARLDIDWRQRVAGNATPDSGPAVTLSVAF